MTPLIPRVVEASLGRLLAAYDGYCEEPYALGEFVTVREGRFPVIGVVVSSQSRPEDPSRTLQPRGQPGQSGAEIMEDNPEIRLLLETQLGVVTCGYYRATGPVAGLPPVPAPLLGAVERASPVELTDFLGDCAFLERLVAEPEAPDAAITEAVRSGFAALGTRGAEFRVAAGRELARLLRADPARLGTILRGVADDQ